MSEDLREKVARAALEGFVEGNETWDEVNDMMRLRSYFAADAILNLIGGDGWKLVPVEPTREMLKAASAYEDQCAIQNYGAAADAEGLWAAMIEASPPPPVTP